MLAFKNHRNGIKKPKRFKHPSMKGVSWPIYCIVFILIFHPLIKVDPKFLRNLKYVKKGNMKVARREKLAKSPTTNEAQMDQ
jgi:ACR3 family arsenite efflux pump ArsB